MKSERSVATLAGWGKEFREQSAARPLARTSVCGARAGLRVIAIVAAIMTAIGGGTAAAAEGPNFYQGKTITIVVGGDAGGPYDIYARLLSRYLSAHLAGTPNIVFQYMPGAGSVIATNYLYNVAPQDGTVILAPNRTVTLAPILGQQGVRYDPAKINWLGSLNNDVGVLQIAGALQVKTIEDARKKVVIVGATSPLTDGYQYPTLLNNTLGTKFKMVLGYKSLPEVQNAFESGEVQGVENSFLGMDVRFPDWRNTMSVPVQLSLNKHPRLPNIPLVFDFIRSDLILPGLTVAEVEAIWRIILTQQAIGRPYAFGPQVPSDRVKSLRGAFKGALADPGFLSDAEKAKLELQTLDGEQMQTMIAAVSSALPATIDKLRDLIVYKGDPSN